MELDDLEDFATILERGRLESEARRALPIAELFNETDNCRLCDDLNSRIIRHYDEETPVSSFSPNERIVHCVVLAQGIIRNGGFHYLFESNFHGDPGYIYTAASFRKIGATSASAAFERALGLFKNSKLPSDITVRLKIFNTVPRPLQDELDDSFWSANDEIWEKLAVFVRANKDSFAHL